MRRGLILGFVLLGILGCPSHDEADDDDSAQGGGGTAVACPPSEAPQPDGSCLAPGVQPNGCPAGEGFVEGTGCVAAGIQRDGCPAGEVGTGDGACEPAGIPPGACGAGFTHDGDVGCDPVLPAATCATGEVAFLGETTCHAVRSCGAAPWGGIPTPTLYVDDDAAGGGNGSAGAPYATIQAAVDAATAGDVIAIADGVYAEDVVVDLPVTLFGLCPDLVTIDGTAAAVTFGPGANGAALRAVSVTGSGVGVDIRGAVDVRLEELRVHDTVGDGIAVFDAQPASGVTIRDVLVEDVMHHGVYLSGCDADVARLVVRGTVGVPNQGWGLTVLEDETTLERARAQLESVVLDDNAEVGFFIQSADVTARGLVVRDMRPSATNRFGRGLSIQGIPNTTGTAVVDITDLYVDGARDAGLLNVASDVTLENAVIRNVQTDAVTMQRGAGIGIIDIAPDADRPRLDLRRALIENATENGLSLAAGDSTVTGVVVRDIQPLPGGARGNGITLQYNVLTQRRGSGTFRGVVVQRASETGLLVSGSDAVVQGLVVEDTIASPIYPPSGTAIAAQDDNLVPAKLTLTGSRVERARVTGVFALGATYDIERVLVRDVLPQLEAGTFGRGMGLQSNQLTGAGSEGRVVGCLVERTHETGVFVAGSRTTLEGILVRDIEPAAATGYGGRGISVQVNQLQGTVSDATIAYCDVSGVKETGIFVSGGPSRLTGLRVAGVDVVQSDQFGDGLTLLHDPAAPTDVVLSHSLLTSSARAGVANFGCKLALGNTAIACHAFPLNGEVFEGVPFLFVDDGDNVCGCDGAEDTCRAVSSMLAPPSKLGDGEL